jgi:hypothetical protein
LTNGRDRNNCKRMLKAEPPTLYVWGFIVS